MNIPPLTFTPLFQQKIWGGKRLYAFKGMPEGPIAIGESWEISSLPGYDTIVDEGALAGMSLNQVMNKYAQEILGETLYQKFGKNFPLMVKFLDATEDLSVQVHPGKEALEKLTDKKRPFGKNEVWYIMDAQEDGEIILGLSKDTTPHDLIQSAIEGRLFELVRRIPVQTGQVYYIPSGTIHAIRSGNLILEIQQPLDITYRLWDYDRIDPSTKNKRPLQLAEAVEVANMQRSTEHNIPFRPLPNSATPMISKDFVCLEMVWANAQTMSYEPPYAESFVIMVGVDGCCVVCDNKKNQIEITRGKVALFPATSIPLRIKDESDGKMIAVSVPNPNS